MSSESAGSSNSIGDYASSDPDHRGTPMEPYGSMMPPSSSSTNATIIEESSGESWLDPVTVSEIEEEDRRKRMHNASGASERTIVPDNSSVTADEAGLQQVSPPASSLNSSLAGSQPVQPPIERGVTYVEVDCYNVARSIGPHSADGSCGGPEMGSSPPGIHYASIIDPSTLQGGQVASNNVPLPPPDENYIMMSPPPKNVAASGSSSKSSSLKRSTTGIAPPTGTSSSGSRCGTLERERRMLSMLGLGSGSNTTSSVTSPVTSPVPLGGGGYDESYTMMSPTAGDPHGGLTVITSHSRTASLTSNSRHHETDYVDMSPASRGVGIPPPTSRKNSHHSMSVKHVSSSPSQALTSHLNDSSAAGIPPPSSLDTTGGKGLVLGRSSDAGDVDSPYLLMSPVSAAGAISSGNPILSGNSIIGRLLASGESTGAVSSNNSVIPSSASEGPYAHMEFNAQSDKNSSVVMNVPSGLAPPGIPPPHRGETGGHRGTASSSRISPSSSCSLVSGTPNSVDFVHNRFASVTSDNGTSGTGPGTPLGNNRHEEEDDDDLGESDGMVSAAAKSKCIDIPGKDGGGGDKEVAKTSSSGGGGGGGGSAGDKFAAVTGGAAGGPPPSQSPGGTSMASKIGSWFRHRAGSVPARPVFSGRRGRTQSEGDPEAILSSEGNSSKTNQS